MLTALDAEAHVVQALELGADDYIVRPVTGRELAAPIQALLRHVLRSRSNGGTGSSVIEHVHLAIDFDSRQVSIAAERVDLTPIEFNLLSVLARNRGHVLSRHELFRRVWGP